MRGHVVYEAIKYYAFFLSQSDGWRCVGRGSINHRRPEDSPTHDAEDGDQVLLPNTNRGALLPMNSSASGIFIESQGWSVLGGVGLETTNTEESDETPNAEAGSVFIRRPPSSVFGLKLGPFLRGEMYLMHAPRENWRPLLICARKR